MVQKSYLKIFKTQFMLWSSLSATLVIMNFLQVEGRGIWGIKNCYPVTELADMCRSCRLVTASECFCCTFILDIVGKVFSARKKENHQAATYQEFRYIRFFLPFADLVRIFSLSLEKKNELYDFYAALWA